MSQTETDKEPISTTQSVNISECFGSKDVLELERVMAELEKRGYSCERQLVITKEE